MLGNSCHFSWPCVTFRAKYERIRTDNEDLQESPLGYISVLTSLIAYGYTKLEYTQPCAFHCGVSSNLFWHSGTLSPPLDAFKATKAEACCSACPLTPLCSSLERRLQKSEPQDEFHHFSSASVLVCFKQKLEFIWSGVRKLCAFINAHSCKLKTRFIIPTLGLGGHFSIISLC